MEIKLSQREEGCMNLFDFPQYQIKNKIRLIELFAGIGSQAMALRDIGADFEHWRVCELDKYAIASYNAIHNTNFESSDITKLKGSDLGITDIDQYTYLMTYSFPCQDLSLAGKQKGMKKGSSTRSGLLWEVERLLNETENLPQILLMENVPQVHAEKNMPDFQKWLEFLRSKGYHNFYQDLNAKDFGVPQSRSRCFCVSILSPECVEYEFPTPIKLTKVMKDLLATEVDEKYYINSAKAKELIINLKERNLLVEAKPECLNLYKENGQEESFQNRIYNPEKISPAVTTAYRPNIIEEPAKIKQATKQGFVECKVGGLFNAERPKSNTRRGRVIDGGEVAPTITAGNNEICKVEKNYTIYDDYNSNIPKNQNCIGTLTTNIGSSTIRNRIKLVEKNNFYEQAIKPAEENNAQEGKKTAILPVIEKYRIRKLTPRECWRLMGFNDEDFEKAAMVNSDSQLYKQAGNSIVKNVLMAIFNKMGVTA